MAKVINYEDNQYDLFQELLDNKEWLGIIVSSDDPLFMGRAKIRIYEKFDTLEDQDLPWAFPASSPDYAGGQSKGYGSFSYPKKDTLVRVRFNKEQYHPEYDVVENINENMQAEIKQSYKNCQVLRWDEDENMHIFYTQEKGIMIWLKESYVNIDKNLHITIMHAGSPSKQTFIDGHINMEANTDIIEKSPYIYLNGSDRVDVGTGADENAVRCGPLMQLLAQMAAAIDAKTGAPSTCTAQVQTAKSGICSSIVYIAP